MTYYKKLEEKQHQMWVIFTTLPNKEDIMPMIFTLIINLKVITSNYSYECKKSIPILDAKGNIVMPHFLFKIQD